MISATIRRTVRTLYAFACGYCGVMETEVGSYLTIDHYQPQDAGGSDDISNLVYTCHACNLHKSATWDSVNPPILHPLRTEMYLHIRALPDGTLEGLTPEGTWHIEALHLNRPPMVERRKMRRLIEALLEREAQIREQATLEDQEIQRKKRKVRKSGHRRR